MHRFASVNILSGTADTVDSILDEVVAAGIISLGHPDLWVRRYGGMGVDDARDLRERASLRAVGGSYRVFIFFAASITVEAQNALLKTLEEPSGDAFFFIIVPTPETLLPTVRSRARMITVSSAGAVSSVDAKTFLASSPAKRIDMLKPLLEKGDDDKRDLSAILTFLSELERVLGASLAKKDVRDGLRAIYRARSFLNDKGALVKPLLEQVALLAPVV